jgi:hypothetical protein
VSWASFVKTLLTSTFLGAAVVYAWILLVDPYDDVWFSPPLERAPVSKNQRFSYPALARNPQFDSLIVGTSSVRLLRPGQLDPLLHTAFVNLAMDAAMPYEQAQILFLFIRHHPEIRYAFLGVDDSLWCSLEPAPQFTFRPFPPWMYDEDRWDDLAYLFNSATVGQAWRQFRNLVGLERPRQGSDGYGVFVPPESRYDLEKVRSLIYGGHEREVKPAIDPPEAVSAEERSSWTFPNLELQRQMLRALPNQTIKALILPPYHQFRQPAPGSRQAQILGECKARVAQFARTIPNTTVIDFMVRSPITMDDRSYWDPVHYRVGIAAILGEAIVNVIETGREDKGIGRILTPRSIFPYRAAEPLLPANVVPIGRQG